MLALLLGTRDPDCALHVLAGHADVLRQIFCKMRWPTLPQSLSAEIAGKPLSGRQAEEPPWLVRLRTETDWSNCAAWRLEESADGSTTTWVRLQPVDSGHGALLSAMQSVSLGEGGSAADCCDRSGGVPLGKAVEGASVSFLLRGVRTAGVVIRGAEPSETPPRVRVRHASATTWVEVQHLLSCTAAGGDGAHPNAGARAAAVPAELS